MTCENTPMRPPIEWYGAIAFSGEDIRIIALGTEIFKELDPHLMDHLATWSHIEGEVHPTFKRKVTQTNSAEFIKKVTGFHPTQLYAYAHELNTLYRGQSMGPFPFKVNWIEKQ